MIKLRFIMKGSYHSMLKAGAANKELLILDEILKAVNILSQARL